MERTNARGLTATSLPEPVTLASVDVAFISLRLVLEPIVSTFDARGGDLVPLVKPQFEAGRTEVRDGVVRDPAVHRRVLDDVVEAAIGIGLDPVDAIASPILGPEGNREFLLHIRVPSVGDRLDRSADQADRPWPVSPALTARLDVIAEPVAA
jgi:23S rRNA (cytidine1920-2'-O)/16S rRNA (cytidine1409-2'-O)-methyltransferase